MLGEENRDYINCAHVGPGGPNSDLHVYAVGILLAEPSPSPNIFLSASLGVLKTELRTSCMLNKHPTTKLWPQPS